jgi:hypothetical protein
MINNSVIISSWDVGSGKQRYRMGTVCGRFSSADSVGNYSVPVHPEITGDKQDHDDDADDGEDVHLAAPTGRYSGLTSQY